MLLRLSVNVREFTSWISGKLCLQVCFIEYVHGKLLAANFLSYDIESDRKNTFIGFAYENNKFLVL